MLSLLTSCVPIAVMTALVLPVSLVSTYTCCPLKNLKLRKLYIYSLILQKELNAIDSEEECQEFESQNQTHNPGYSAKEFSLGK